MDINFTNIKTGDGDFFVRIDDIPTIATGNKVLANIFEITFMTNTNDSLMSYGYGGDGIGTVSNSYDPNDLQSIAAAIKVACDNTVDAMKIDQSYDPNIPPTEKIVSARVINVTKNSDAVLVSMDIVPEEYDGGTIARPIILTLPL